MLVLLLLAIIGLGKTEEAQAAWQWAARGTLLAVFAVMQVRRWQCRALTRDTVLWGSVVGGLLGRIGYGFLAGPDFGLLAYTGIPVATSAALMSVSFHSLTLGRGVMR
jgi:hypothetical protein